LDDPDRQGDESGARVPDEEREVPRLMGLTRLWAGSSGKYALAANSAMPAQTTPAAISQARKRREVGAGGVTRRLEDVRLMRPPAR
jgi:hypothetical protein